MSHDPYRVGHDQGQVDHDSIEPNYGPNEHDREPNGFDHDVGHGLVDLVDLDLADFGLVGLGQDNFGRIDRVDQGHEIDRVDRVVEIDFQPIPIDSHREVG